MKKAENILGRVALFALVLDLLLLPGSWMALAVTFGLLAGMYLLFGILIFSEVPLRDIFRRPAYKQYSAMGLFARVLFGIGMSMLLIGDLGSLGIIPGEATGRILVLAGLPLTIAPVLFIYFRKRENRNALSAMILRVAVAGCLGLLMVVQPVSLIFHRDVPVYQPVNSGQDEDTQLHNQLEMQRHLMDEEHVALAFLLLLLVFAYYRYRHKKAMEKHLVLAAERERIAADLHDEIGSTLSSILVYSDVARSTMDPDSHQGKIIARISENASGSMEAMSDIVWMLNPRNDTFENMIVRMQAFAAVIMEAKNITLHFFTDGRLSPKKTDMQQRQHIYLIFREAVNNLVKYAGATEASVRITLEGDIFSMRISDNGRGFEPHGENTGNGLRTMQMRAKKLNGELQLQSSPGKGTEICLTLQIP